MPILVTLDPRTPRILMDPDRRRLDFATADGDVLDMGDGAFVVMAGLQGLRVPPRRISTQQFPGLPGGRLQTIIDDARDVIVPLFVIADDGVSRHMDQLAQIRSLMDFRAVDYAVMEGTFDLQATAQDAGGTRRLRCTYVDGMEGSEGGSAAAGHWSMFDVKLLAVDPYWRGESWTTPTVSLPSANPFLSNDGPAHPLRLSSAVALGLDMPVTIPGDVASPAIVELVGPATSTDITSPSGLDITIGPLGSGQQFLLDTGRTRRALLNGVSRWDKVGTSPKFRPLAPGGTTISIAMAGATDDSRARVYGTSLWESAW